jgi:lysophospholipase L1-like esterase
MNRHARTSHRDRRPSLLWTSPLRGLLATALLAATACASSSASAPPAADPSSSSQPSASAAPQRYVALGDSYSAAPFVPVTDVAGGCLRSSANYPSLVAEKLGAEADDVTCSAARTPDLSRNQFPDVAPQIKAVTSDTDLVTIGIGGNDEGVFARLIGECPRLRADDPTGAPCQARMSAGGGDELLTALGRTSRRIEALAEQVHQRAPEAEVLLVGYPHIVAASDTCPELPLAKGDYAYAEKVNLALTDAVRRAARATDSTYIDVWKASKGHDICSSDPWINGSANDQKRAAAYHPFAVEQAAVADLVVAAAR